MCGINSSDFKMTMARLQLTVKDVIRPPQKFMLEA